MNDLSFVGVAFGVFLVLGGIGLALLCLSVCLFTWMEWRREQ